jgi:hypothetical protein
MYNSSRENHMSLGDVSGLANTAEACSMAMLSKKLSVEAQN